MEAKEFFTAWTTFVQKSVIAQGDIKSLWTDYKDWTKRTLGFPKSEGRDMVNADNEVSSPFGNYFIEQVGNEWRYWKEDRNIDLALSRAPNFRLSALRKDEKDYPEGFYPRCYDILVEQEAGGWFSWQEMLKLIHMRARLKVVITYGKDLKAGNRDAAASDETAKHILSMFKEGIEQAASAFCEDQSTRYLLIIGYKTDKGIMWCGWSFDANGNEKWSGSKLQEAS